MYWLVKSEPECWSWEDHQRAGVAEWDGVRNALAQKYLAQMVLGDRSFFYHTGRERSVLGLLNVVRTAYPDPSDPTGRSVMVDFQALESLSRPVTLAEIKAEPKLAHLALIRQSRLSVMPIDPPSWTLILAMASQG